MVHDFYSTISFYTVVMKCCRAGDGAVDLTVTGTYNNNYRFICISCRGNGQNGNAFNLINTSGSDLYIDSSLKVLVQVTQVLSVSNGGVLFLFRLHCWNTNMDFSCYGTEFNYGELLDMLIFWWCNYSCWRNL